MKKLFRILLSLLCMFSLYNTYTGFFSNVWDQIKGAGEQVGSFFEAMGAGFGADPSGYQTNLRVFNNSTVPIQVCCKRVKNVMGMNFHSGVRVETGAIWPGEDTGQQLQDVSLYLQIVLRASSDGGNSFNEIFEDTIASEEPEYNHCKDTYVYNYYTDPEGVKTEYLGYNKGTTDQFFGQIYNGLSEPCYVRYTFDKEVFTVLLEPNTFNFLSGDTTIPNCMRPGTLTFTFLDGSTQDVTLTAQGLADQSPVIPANESNNQNYVPTQFNTSPMQYHYEIYNNSKGKPQVYTMGLGIGNYKPSVNGDIRLIGPVTCYIWNQSPDQLRQYPGCMYIQSPERTVWFGYGTPGWANKTTGVKNMIIGKIPYGEAVKFRIVRPTVWPYQITTSSGYSLITQNLSARDMLPIKNVNIDPTKSNVTQSFYRRTGRFLNWGLQTPTTLNETESQEENLLGELLAPVNLHIYMDAISSTTAKGQLYIMSLNTADEEKARLYMEKLIAGQLKYDYKTQDSMVQTIEQDSTALTQKNLLSKQTQIALLSNSLKTDYGMIYDSETGITGRPLIIDSFIPYGNGLGPYYYSVQAPMQSLSLENLMWLQSYLTSNYFTDSGNGAAFTQVLQQWITTIYSSDTVVDGMQNVYSDVVSFLLQNGQDTLFNVNNGIIDRKNLGPVGNYVLTTLLAGPTSIINSPLFWTAGNSYYVISGTSVPTTFNPSTNTFVNAWNPTATTIFNQPSPALAKISDQNLGLGIPYSYSAGV